MKVVIGLGNPGLAYTGTRHNVGFMVLEYLAAGTGYGPWSEKNAVERCEGQEFGEKVLLVKPLAYMNLSGRPVRQVVEFYKIELPDLLVVTDDVNLPLGQIRLRGSGSAGGHNGLKDVERHLGAQDYARLRLGVGDPGGQRDLADYVLARFKPSERNEVDSMIVTAAEAVRVWLKEGLAVAMNRFNAKKKEKPGAD